MAPASGVGYLLGVGTTWNIGGSGATGSLSPAELCQPMILIKMQSGKKSPSHSQNSPKAARRRAGNCSSHRSVLRPARSVVPAFLTRPDGGLKGYGGFAMRRSSGHP